MKHVDYFHEIKPGEIFSIEEDDGSAKFCFKVIIDKFTDGYVIFDSSFKIEYGSPFMTVLKNI